MPELPEVEVIKQGLEQYLPGRKVVGFSAGRKKLRKPMPHKGLEQYIRNAKIKALDRRAKFLLILMDNGATLIIHLGMTGRLGIFPAGSPSAKHDHLKLLLDNGLVVRYNDIRRFGFIEVMEPGQGLKGTMLENLGPEPLGPDFTPKYLKKVAANKSRPLKNFLMDNRVVVGIGNIYACEILFHARLKPTKEAKTLTIRQWTKVVESSRYVLQKAIDSGGTTISDFVNESGRTGYFQLELQTYGRRGQPCTNCSTPITRKTMAGRSTFFCPKCQK
jgi:formamidopyrimidine-DNA glycosylase